MFDDDSIFELLRKDHEALLRACRDLRAHVDDPGFEERAAPFMSELRRHERAEAKVLSRPLLLRVPEGVIGDALQRQHLELDRAIDELALAQGTRARRDALDEMIVRLSSHFEYEQDRVFPATSYLFAQSVQREMAKRFADERAATP